MQRHYPAVIHKEPDSDFGISFPDFPGCISAGASVDEAILSGTEALNGHIALMAQDNDPIPAPTPIQSVVLEPEFADSVVCVTLVPAVIPGRIKRISVTMDESLLNEIDGISDNRSGFLAAAARAELVRRRAAA